MKWLRDSVSKGRQIESPLSFASDFVSCSTINGKQEKQHAAYAACSSMQQQPSVQFGAGKARPGRGGERDGTGAAGACSHGIRGTRLGFSIVRCAKTKEAIPD